MSQALYDAQHGMSPEELWSRYSQYPWRDASGNLVMQSEPTYYKGPVMPNNIKPFESMAGVSGYYKPSNGEIYINDFMLRGKKLSTLNHELQHKAQNIAGTLSDTDKSYFDRLSEAQARITGSMSEMPDSYKRIVNPLSLTRNSRPITAGYLNMPKFFDSIGNLGIPTNDKLSKIENTFAQIARKLPDSSIGLLDEFEMDRAKKKFGPQVMPTLDELLLQGREPYYPPFVSQGLQK
jgi:hypothetical protein